MRTATGGLAASDSTMPLSISARIAPSIGRSTVHHQSDRGLRSSRESMGGSFGTALPLVADGGYRGVNEAAKTFVGWVERSDTHQMRLARRWVSLRSTHPTPMRSHHRLDAR